MTIRNLTGSARILAALGVTSLALVAASPANAIYRDYESYDQPPVTERAVERETPEPPPVDKNGKKSCPGGFDSWSPHGTVATLWYTNSKGDVVMTTLRCNDGRWEVVSVQAPEGDNYKYQADEGWLEESGTLVLVNPHEEYSYSNEGGSYAAP
jgi:hypothetical protein